MTAADNGQTEVVELLLSIGANIEAANKVMIFSCWLNIDIFISGFRRDYGPSDRLTDQRLNLFFGVSVILLGVIPRHCLNVLYLFPFFLNLLSFIFDILILSYYIFKNQYFDHFTSFTKRYFMSWFLREALISIIINYRNLLTINSSAVL